MEAPICAFPLPDTMPVADPYRHPPIEPYRSGMLAASALHRVAWRACGSPEGLPVVELHGGPGAGSEPAYRRLFDPARWCIVEFDQRGCGASTPLAETRENTTADLIRDMEALRSLLGFERWVVTGWSWGATLALAYAQAHPERVLALVLRGTWTATPDEAAWFERGVGRFFPDTHERFEHAPTDVDGSEWLGHLFRQASDSSLPMAEREQAARDYGRYELYAAYLEADDAEIDRVLASGPQLPVAVISAHYWEHGWFLGDGVLWRELPRIAHLPCVLIHGRYDVVVPPEISYRLHKAWPGSELHIVPRSGHMSSEPEMAAVITSALERLADRLHSTPSRD